MQATTVHQLRQPHPDQDLIDARAARLLRSSSRWANGSGERPKNNPVRKEQSPQEPNGRT